MMIMMMTMMVQLMMIVRMVSLWIDGCCDVDIFLVMTYNDNEEKTGI